MHSAADSIALVAHWTFYCIFFFLLGRASLRLSCGAASPHFFDSAWTGILVCTGALQIWHLFLPVSQKPFWILFGLAAIGAIPGLPGVFAGPKQTSKLNWALLLLTAFWLAHQTFDPTFIYDSEVYHFATIRWNSAHALVPGLGNLFIYFGLNQAYFLFAALLDRVSAFHEGCLSVNGFLVLLLAAECLHAASQVLDSRRTRPSYSAICLCLALPFVLKLGLHNLGSPTPDVMVDALIVRFFSRLVLIFEETSPADALPGVVACVIFSAAAVPIKASLAGFAFGSEILLLGIARYGWSAGRQIWPRTLLISLVSGVFFVVPFLIRGVICSGYPLLPSTLFSFPVDWRMPEAEVREFALYIRGFARSHEHGAKALFYANNMEWIGPWMKRTLFSMPGLTLALSVFTWLPVAWLAGMRRKPDMVRPAPQDWAVLLVPGLAFAFWLAAAPDLRFGAYLFYILSIWLWCRIFTQSQGLPFLGDLLRLAPIGVIVLSLVILCRAASWYPGGYPRAPEFHLVELRLASGLTVSVPNAPPEADEWRIGYATPPATARAAPDLALRSDSLSGGFRLTGAFPGTQK
jgi:hypothetical protein